MRELLLMRTLFNQRADLRDTVQNEVLVFLFHTTDKNFDAEQTIVGREGRELTRGPALGVVGRGANTTRRMLCCGARLLWS